MLLFWMFCCFIPCKQRQHTFCLTWQNTFKNETACINRFPSRGCTSMIKIVQEEMGRYAQLHVWVTLSHPEAQKSGRLPINGYWLSSIFETLGTTEISSISESRNNSDLVLRLFIDSHICNNETNLMITAQHSIRINEQGNNNKHNFNIFVNFVFNWIVNSWVLSKVFLDRSVNEATANDTFSYSSCVKSLSNLSRCSICLNFLRSLRTSVFVEFSAILNYARARAPFVSNRAVKGLTNTNTNTSFVF